MSLTITRPADTDRAVVLSGAWNPDIDPNVQVVGANTVQRLAVIHQLVTISCQQHGETIIPAPAWMAPGSHIDEVERTLLGAVAAFKVRRNAPESQAHSLTLVVDEYQTIAREARNAQQLQRINGAIRQIWHGAREARMHVIVGTTSVSLALDGQGSTVAVGPLTDSEREILHAHYPGVHLPAIEDGEAWFAGATTAPRRVRI